MVVSDGFVHGDFVEAVSRLEHSTWLWALVFRALFSKDNFKFLRLAFLFIWLQG